MNFHQRYFSLKLTLAPFRLKSDFETVKTVAAIDALADRADMLYRGCGPGVKRDGSCYDCPPGTEPEPMLAKAEYYLKALQDGKYPLAGCFAEPRCTLIDHTFFQKDSISTHPEKGIVAMEKLFEKHKPAILKDPVVAESFFKKKASFVCKSGENPKEEFKIILNNRFSLVNFVKYILSIIGLYKFIFSLKLKLQGK